MKEEFEQWKLIHIFMHGDDIKGWITEENFIDVYRDGWGALMEVVDKIESWGYCTVIGKCESIWCNIYTINDEKKKGDNASREMVAASEGHNKKEVVYQSVVKFIEWHNDNIGS